jgi:hypothetical protein
MDADVGEGIRIQPGVIDRGGEIEQGQMLEEQGGECFRRRGAGAEWRQR